MRYNMDEKKSTQVSSPTTQLTSTNELIWKHMQNLTSSVPQRKLATCLQNYIILKKTTEPIKKQPTQYI